uniref:Anaphase-promoting complex subunit 13 n=1 Tax=Caenorhabditis japonica TaxID=281687 RepID=A0A8R1EHY0_CAEJA
MSFVPSEVRLDHTFLEWDREWIFQRLPKNEVLIPREFEPDIEADSIPSNTRQAADPNTTWTETGIDQIQMGPSGAHPKN